MEKKSFIQKGDWFKGRPEEKDDLYDLGNDDLEEKQQKEEAAQPAFKPVKENTLKFKKTLKDLKYIEKRYGEIEMTDDEEDENLDDQENAASEDEDILEAEKVDPTTL